WKAARLPGTGALPGHVLTLAFVMVGWALFRAASWDEAGRIFSGLAGAHGLSLSPAMGAALRPLELVTLALGIGLIYLPKLMRIDPSAPNLG
ncbi:hypothetical protein ACNQ1D_26525, partial [Enterobacter cloacae complex sp.6700005]|uniref:hypothetical protein n=1 Tax=Enterobacter cloacae complex sp.6700005 TaxID=3397180 RepID=UPI003AAAB3EE